jgi:acetylornithine/N-succinyldiaminopimelate aminotransferase
VRRADAHLEPLPAPPPGPAGGTACRRVSGRTVLLLQQRRGGRESSGPERHVIVSAEGSFHGRTTGALAATGQEQYRKDFEPLLPGFRYVPFGDANALENAVGEDTCAVMLEPIQGEGGVVVPPDGYLARAAELCRERGALLVYDEVQTGFGRTGTFFAWQHDGVVPDVITLSKAMGGGLPLGAMGARGEAAGAFIPGSHASTFGGNPVACAASLAVLDILLDDGLLEESGKIAAFFRAGLEEMAGRLPVVREVRGRGLLLAVELDVEAKPVVAAALEAGYLINAVQQQTLRFAPPFIITEEELASFLPVLERILREQS